MATRIPQILFSYWSGNTASLLHIISLRSARVLNPSARVIVYTAKAGQVVDRVPHWSSEHANANTNQYGIQEFGRVPGVEVIEVDLAAECAVAGPLFHSYAADVVRIRKLREHGGVWFDMDVLFMQALTEPLAGPLGSGKSLAAAAYSKTIATGLVSCTPDSRCIVAMNKALDASLDAGVSVRTYQMWGPDLWRDTLGVQFAKFTKDVQPFDSALVYPYIWNELALLFSESPKTPRVTSSTVGVHWYNGNPLCKQFAAELAQDPAGTLERRGSVPLCMALSRARRMGVDLAPPQ
jgi:hypothetical protein